VVEGNTLRIEHGLLNPGDSVSIEILFEGDPGDINQLPPVSYRIADILEPITKYLSNRPLKFQVTYFPLSRLWETILVILTSFIPLVLIGISIGLLSDVRKRALISKREIRNRITSSLNHRQIVQRTLYALNEESAIINKVGLEPDIKWFDDRSVIENLFVRPASLTALQQQSLNPAEAAVRVHDALRRTLPAVAGYRLYMELPYPYDHQVQTAVSQMTMIEKESAEDFLRRVRDTAETVMLTQPFSKRIATILPDIAGALACFLFGIASALIMTGSWQILLQRSQ
jgi:hypothetical protein